MLTETIISLSMSGTAIVISLVSVWYVRKNVNMKAVEFKQSQDARVRAAFRVSAEHAPMGKYYVRITNVGQSEARNVDCVFAQEEFSGIHIAGKEQFPYPVLRSGETIKLVFLCDMGKNSNPTFWIAWSDDANKHNSTDLTVSLI